MGSKDDRDASKARARRLHAEIERLKERKPDGAPPHPPTPATTELPPETSPGTTPGATSTREPAEETTPPPSPAAPDYRDFIEQRMREWKEKTSKGEEDPAPGE